MSSRLNKYVTGMSRLGKIDKAAFVRKRQRWPEGFTLLEMLISLIIGTLIVGGVMGLISGAMQQKFQIRDKSQIQPVLESAAQMILADPQRALDGSITLTENPGSPVVGVALAPIELGERTAGTATGRLCRVMVRYRTGQLEFSVIIPEKDM